MGSWQSCKLYYLREDTIDVQSPQIIFYHALRLYALSGTTLYNDTLQTGKGWVTAFYLKSQHANMFWGLCGQGPDCFWGSPRITAVLIQRDHLHSQVGIYTAWAEPLTLNQSKIKNCTILNIKAIQVPLLPWTHAVYYKMKTKKLVL